MGVDRVGCPRLKCLFAMWRRIVLHKGLFFVCLFVCESTTGSDVIEWTDRH